MTTRRDRGAADALGLVILAPFVIGLALVVVWIGRSVNVDAQLRTAAEAGAQAAALERSHSHAAIAARSVVEAMLADSAECDDIEVLVPRSADRGVGMEAGLIEVTVTCTLDRAVVPGRHDRRSQTAWATVDRFREDRP